MSNKSSQQSDNINISVWPNKTNIISNNFYKLGNLLQNIFRYWRKIKNKQNPNLEFLQKIAYISTACPNEKFNIK